MMEGLFLAWLLLIAAFLYLTSRKARLSPMLLAYVATLSVIHVPGVINYLGPADVLRGDEETRLGFEATLFGMTMLLLGSLLARTPIKQLEFGSGKAMRRRTGAADAETRLNNHALGLLMLVVGVGAYFIAMPIASRIPSMSALVSPMGSLLIVGAWFYLWDAAVRRDRKQLGLILLLLPLLPASTLLIGGFLGFGIGWLICILAVAYCFWPRRVLFVAAAPFVAYLGLSVGAAYFLERAEIREAVWGKAEFSERVDRVMQIFERFEPFSVKNMDHVQAIDERLNQNYLVGSGIFSHREGYTGFYYGSSVPLWSLVPRVVWPEKPEIGGGLNLVSQFTGIEFADGTSVGTGHVLEFYMNFGWHGILFGFLLLGFVIARLDQLLVYGFRHQDLPAILMAGLVGMALLQPGGNLMEMVVSAVGAIVVAKGTAYLLVRYVQKHRARFAADATSVAPAVWLAASR
jgi:hypothetical protein